MVNDQYPTRQSDTATIRLRTEPVCYGHWDDSAPVSQAQAEQFDRDGFLILEDVFNPIELATLQSAAQQALNSDIQLNAETIITEPDSNAIRSIFEIHRQCKVMQRLATDVRLAGVASFLLSDEVYIHQSRLNYKPGFKGQPFYWHSDFETWHAEDGMPNMRAISFSVLLTDNTPYNGPLMLLPGSHRRFLSCIGKTPDDHYKQSLKKQEYGVPDDENLVAMFNEFGVVSAVAKAGSVIVFDCNTMHGSNSNISPLPRSNAFFVFNAMSNQLTQPFSSEKPRPSFIASRAPSAIQPVAGEINDASHSFSDH